MNSKAVAATGQSQPGPLAVDNCDIRRVLLAAAEIETRSLHSEPLAWKTSASSRRLTVLLLHRLELIEIIFIFIHQAGSNMNNNNNRKLNYKHLIVAKLAKPFTIEIYRNVNLSYLLLRKQLGTSIAKQLWQSFTTSILPVLKSFIQRRLKV